MWKHIFYFDFEWKDIPRHFLSSLTSHFLPLRGVWICIELYQNILNWSFLLLSLFTIFLAMLVSRQCYTYFDWKTEKERNEGTDRSFFSLSLACWVSIAAISSRPSFDPSTSSPSSFTFQWLDRDEWLSLALSLSSPSLKLLFM